MAINTTAYNQIIEALNGKAILVAVIKASKQY
jgi:hypothetical protein